MTKQRSREAEQRQKYADKILEGYTGEASQAYFECYGGLKTEDESELEFIERMAADFDFFDGYRNAAAFQEIFDEIIGGK